MRWALWIVGSLAAIVALVAIIGAMLPKGHVATRAAKFRASPDAVWQAITGYEDFPKWRPGVTNVTRMPDANGHVVFMEKGGSSAQDIPYEIVESVVPAGTAPGKLVAKIADPKLPFGGSWTYEVSAADGGTVLRITERGEVYNPIFRFVSKFFMSQTKTMDDYLNALGKKFGETVTISE
ncbi:MAG TPA: SRPBCC family protein [Candidatus Acidoferrales bacterium]